MDIELTHTTEEIMNYLWRHEEGLPFRQIYDYFTLTQHKTWKRQTLYTHLTILMDKGFIKTEGTRRKMNYIPVITFNTYREILAKDTLNKYYGGSVLQFISALSNQNAIANSDATALIDYLKTFIQ